MATRDRLRFPIAATETGGSSCRKHVDWQNQRLLRKRDQPSCQGKEKAKGPSPRTNGDILIAVHCGCESFLHRGEAGGGRKWSTDPRADYAISAEHSGKKFQVLAIFITPVIMAIVS